MREIKFRGKRQKNGEWIYGSYISRGHHNYLYDLIIDDKNRKKAVMMKTVGQYTGLKDKNGKGIYEGDIVKSKISFEGKGIPHMGEVVYDKELASFATKNLSGNTLICRQQLNTFEVVGNKYENPDLLDINLEEGKK